MKKILSIFIALVCFSAFAENTPDVPAPLRVSVFSTTVDWEAVTGLHLQQYTGKVSGTSKYLVKEGLVLYYLDAFPCYGEADSVRVWLSPTGKMSGNLRIVCLYKPETISFAYRNATEEETDGRSIGLLTCPIEGKRDFKIDISKCIRGKDWTEYR
jgi:hypothetical protein